MLKSRKFMEGIDYVDVDYCRFSNWGYQKPTRIWGPAEIGTLLPRLCAGQECPNVGLRSNGYYGHKLILGATPKEGARRVRLEDQYRIPEGVIEYICGWGITDQDLKTPTTSDDSTGNLTNVRDGNHDTGHRNTGKIQSLQEGHPIPKPPSGPPPPLLTPQRSPATQATGLTDSSPLPIAAATATGCSLCQRGLCGYADSEVPKPPDERAQVSVIKSKGSPPSPAAPNPEEWLPGSRHNARRANKRKEQSPAAIVIPEERIGEPSPQPLSRARKEKPKSHGYPWSKQWVKTMDEISSIPTEGTQPESSSGLEISSTSDEESEGYTISTTNSQSSASSQSRAQPETQSNTGRNGNSCTQSQSSKSSSKSSSTKSWSSATSSMAESLAASLNQKQTLSMTSENSRFSSASRHRARIVRETECPSVSSTSTDAIVAR